MAPFYHGLLGNSYDTNGHCTKLPRTPSSSNLPRSSRGWSVSWCCCMNPLSTAHQGSFFMLTKISQYYLPMWYCRHEIQFRQALFFSAASIAGAFSGLLAFAISKMNGVGGLAGWRWIFILEGIATVLIAAMAFFVLHDFP